MGKWQSNGKILNKKLMITSNLLSFNCFAKGDTKKIVNDRLAPLTTVFASRFQFPLHSSPKQGAIWLPSYFPVADALPSLPDV